MQWGELPRSVLLKDELGRLGDEEACDGMVALLCGSHEYHQYQHVISCHNSKGEYIIISGSPQEVKYHGISFTSIQNVQEASMRYEPISHASYCTLPRGAV